MNIVDVMELWNKSVFIEYFSTTKEKLAWKIAKAAKKIYFKSTAVQGIWDAIVREKIPHKKKLRFKKSSNNQTNDMQASLKGAST